MYNPFCLFSAKLLQAFIKTGKKYFVRQTFNRAFVRFDEDIKGYFLISHYNDLASAEAHYNALTGDAHRFLYDWENEDHRKKLIAASKHPVGYKIYANVFEKDWEKKIRVHLKEKFRRYIEGKLRWSPARSDQVNFQIYVQFGEPYAQIKFRSQEVRVKLAEVENYK